MMEFSRRPLVQILYWFVGYLNLYTNMWENYDMLRDRRMTISNEIQGGQRRHNSTYDFIVVGGGTAGSIVANRLSAKYSVLLLEAGGDPFPMSDIPSFSLLLLDYPALDWMHRTVPQRNACLALYNQESGWSQGKSLGGTSNINFLIHSRGHPQDFDNWAKIVKDESWNFEGVLPFFRKSEDYNGEYSDNGFHGKNGPMRLELSRSNRAADVYLQALNELGYPKVDVNGNFSLGFDKIYYPMKRGRRQGTFNAYLKPIRNRQSLTVRKYAHVNKILISEDKEAFGVEFSRHGQIEQAFVNKEVILSAGAIQSPKILMLSGIGDKKQLELLKIPPKVDSPHVGQNLQDHISLYLGPFFVRPGSRLAYNFERDIGLGEFSQYYLQGLGPLTTSGLEVQGFLRVNTSNSNTTTPDPSDSDSSRDWPNIQYLFSGVNIFSKIAYSLYARAFHLREDIIQKYYTHAVGRDYFFVIVSLARPLQRGEILLKSSDPTDKLDIDPKYLQTKEDVVTLVEGVKTIVDIIERAPTFKKMGAKYTTVPFPGCENPIFRSDDYWECMIRQYAITLHHIVGTCSMTSKDKAGKEGVVDPELNVIGVKNLRVIDASVMPRVTSGNTNAPTVMVGEKGSDMVLKKWAAKEI